MHRYTKPIQVEVLEGDTSEKNGIYFFGVIRVIDYLPFLQNAINRSSAGYNNTSSAHFGPYEAIGIDEDDYSIPENQVLLSTYTGHTFLSLLDFYNLCLQLVEKSLEAVELYDLKGKGVVDDKWVKEMQEMTPKIKEVIRSL